MEYSNEFLARVYGAYMGCGVAIGDNRTHVLESVNSFEVNVGCSLLGTVIAYFTFDEAKLLLTPLSQISDEDAIEVANILGLSYNNDPESECYYDLAGLIHDLTSNSDDYIKMHFNGSGVLIDFLRSKGYDMGFSNIPLLIEAGIAIDKTKI